jgi:hypothetical protein
VEKSLANDLKYPEPETADKEDQSPKKEQVCRQDTRTIRHLMVKMASRKARFGASTGCWMEMTELRPLLSGYWRVRWNGRLRWHSQWHSRQHAAV